jgi:Zn-dependent alcohol dehydrogenase
MNLRAAALRKVHEPLAIDSVEFDKPRGCDVLVRTATTRLCHSDLHVAGPDTLWPK